MNRIHLIAILMSFLVFSIVILGGCSKKSENNGTPIVKNDTVKNGIICIENRSDSTILVSINEVHEQFSILKDYMHCSELKGNSVYHINYSSPQIYGDTILNLVSGGNMLLILQ